MKIMPNDPSKAQALTNYAPQPQQNERASAKDVSSSPQQVPQDQGDKAEISDRAHEILDLRAAVDAGRDVLLSIPEVREDRVAEVRARLAQGFYNSGEVRDKVAGRVADMFMDNPML